MKNIYQYLFVGLMTSAIIGCSAAPPAQPEPAQTTEPVIAEAQPEPVAAPVESVPPATEPKAEPAAKQEPVVKQEPLQPAAPAKKAAPVKIERLPPAAPAQEKPAVKLERLQPATPIQEKPAVKQEEPPAQPEPVVEEKAPVEEVKPEPVAEKDTIIAEFGEVTITKETYDQTKTEMEKLVQQLNRITAAKDYTKWISFLSTEYQRLYSQAATLKTVSEALPVKGIKLKSLKDYFSYVFVPSRQNVRVDDIKFVSPTRVNVIMKQGNVSLLIYALENIDGNWKLLPPKL